MGTRDNPRRFRIIEKKPTGRIKRIIIIHAHAPVFLCTPTVFSMDSRRWTLGSRIDETEETRWGGGARFFALPHSSGFVDTLNKLRRML